MAFVLSFNLSLAKIGDWGNNLRSSAVGTQYADGINGYTDSSTLAFYIGKILYIGPFLGIIFIMQMVTAGYEWMTAAGESKKVDDAKKRMQHAVIGLTIFIGLYVIAYFIVTSLVTITGNKGA